MMRACAVAIIVALIAIPAAAQTTEIGAVAGFTPSASLDRHADELQGVSLDGGVTFALSVTRFLSDRWGVGVEWGQQFSGFSIDTGDTSVRLYDMGIGRFHGFAVYRFAEAAARTRPFVFAGAGAKFLWAHDLGSETKPSLALGGGLAYAVARSLALEGRVTYTPTLMNDRSAEDFCDAFGFCQSTLQQFELMGGIRFRF
jgi:opacity protein-like surface antigen